MKTKGRILRAAAALMLIILAAVLCACGAQDGSVTILYTNDVHAYINNEAPAISYAQLAKMKADLGEGTLLLDAGDHVQGAVYGAMDQGAGVLEIMDGMYDASALGNHEFDYGMERALAITSNSKYPYVSCNFVHAGSEKPVLSPHVMLKAGGVKVGVVGISTPETLTSSAPSYFQDENGSFIYAFLEGDKLYNAVQSSIDTLKKRGADYIIALGHVGVDEASETTSRKIIANVCGLDAFIDGHSHTEIASEAVLDKNGEEVILTQTGSYLGGVGKLTLSREGVKAEIIKEYAAFDEAVQAASREIIDSVEAILGEKIASLGTAMPISDENGKRVVRVMGAEIGNFVADSYYYYVNFVSQLNCDVAIINGGGLRAELEAGDITYKSLKSVNPFGNMLCAVELSGQQILDMLEWGARSTTGVAGENESGAFLHTAGLVYTIDTTVKSTVLESDTGAFAGAPSGEYRVRDVKIYDKASCTYLPLDLNKKYCVAGANFTLVDRGDGFEMIDGRTVLDYIAEDYMALAVFAVAHEDVNDDGLSDISAENSPLSQYKGYEKADRITVVR